MEMVPYIPNAEFTTMMKSFLQQPTGEQLLEAFLHDQKAVILFKLDTQRSISEATLDLLIRLGKMEVSAALKRAFREAVVDCALRPLKRGEGEGGVLFFERVKRICDKVKLTAGLGSEELTSWKRDIQEAAWDDDVCRIVLERFESVRAEEAVRVYVKEEKDKMGASFMSVVADKVKTNRDFERLFKEFMDQKQQQPPAANSTPSSSGRRRRNRRWSAEEEEALMAGVANFEEGRWKMILNDNPEAFDDRTERDLKDKWRNLKKGRL